MNNIYTPWPLGVALTFATLFWAWGGGGVPCGPSCHGASCDVVRHCNHNLSESVTCAIAVFCRFISPVRQKRGDLGVALQPLFFFPALWKCWANIDPVLAPFVSPTVFQTGSRMNLYVFSSAVNPKTLKIASSRGQWQKGANMWCQCSCCWLRLPLRFFS